MDDKKAINKRTKIGLREEILFIGLGLFFEFTKKYRISISKQKMKLFDPNEL